MRGAIVFAIVALAIKKLQTFLNSSDRNLRFLALDLYKEVVEKFKEKTSLKDLHDKVLTSIEDSARRSRSTRTAQSRQPLVEPDLTVRRVALQLLDRIVDPSNFQEAVQRLLEFSRKATLNDEFIGTILRMAARDRYALVEDEGQEAMEAEEEAESLGLLLS
eukprot:g29431.t1